MQGHSLTHSIVLLANIFLAIAVDKLLEVNEVEKDITKRVEKMEEQRREREKQLSALKNPSSEPSGLGRTLKKIVLLYSFNVSREEEIKRRKINKKKRPRSELIRRVSTQSEITLQERRKSFNDNRATSDPIRYNGGDDDDDTIDPTTIANTNTNRGRLFPHKVILKNPLRKVEESIELQSYHTEPRRGYLDKMDSMTSITDEYDDFDWFKKRPSASIRTVPDPERNKGPDVHQLVRTLSMPVSDASSSQYSISRNTSIESGMNTSSMVSSDSFMSQGSSLLFGNSPLPESNQLPDNIDSLLRGNYPSRYSPGTTSKVLPSSRTVPGPLVPGNNPIMKPGATPMIVSSNNVDDDDSMTRLARQSSLEEITPVVLSEEVTEHQQERMTDSKVRDEVLYDCNNNDLLLQLKHYKESLKMKSELYLSVCPSFCLSVHLSVCPSVCPSFCLSICLSVCLSVCPSVCLSNVHLSVCLSVHLSVCPSFCLSVCPMSICLSVCLSVCPSFCLSIFCLSICLSVHISVCPSVCLSIFLSVCLPSVCLCVCLSVCHLSIFLSVHLLSVHLSVCLSVHISVCPSVCLSIFLSVCLPSVCLCVCPSVCLSAICLSVRLSIHNILSHIV